MTTHKQPGESDQPERPAPDTKPGGQGAEAQQEGSGKGSTSDGGRDSGDRAFGAKPGDLGPVTGDTEASKERSGMTQRGGRPAGEGENLNQGAQQGEDEKRRRALAAKGRSGETDPATDPNDPETGEGDVEVSFPADQLGGVDWNKVAETMGDYHVGGDSTNEAGRRIIRFAPGAADDGNQPTQLPA